MKKIFLYALFIPFIFSTITTLAQQVPDTPITNFVPQPKAFKTTKPVKSFSLTGRVLGVNLENVQGAVVTNRRTAEKTTTDSQGIYRITAAKSDTLTFEIAKYSKSQFIIRLERDKVNIIMIKRKADDLPAGHSASDYKKAHNEDDDLYRILEKDAKLEGKWNY